MADSPENNTNGVLRLKVSTNGKELDDTIGIVSVEVGKTINKIPTARIVVLDGDMPERDFAVSNEDTFKPGTEIKIGAGYDEGEETIFQGIIIKHGIKISGDNYARLVVECQDKAVGMTVGRKNANYVDATDSDIISKLIGAYSGLSSDVGSTTATNKELVQYYCTDWDFLLSRLSANQFTERPNSTSVVQLPLEMSWLTALTKTLPLNRFPTPSSSIRVPTLALALP